MGLLKLLSGIIVSTLDPEAGSIVFHIAPGCERDVETILQDLQKDIMMEPAQINA